MSETQKFRPLQNRLEAPTEEGDERKPAAATDAGRAGTQVWLDANKRVARGDF